MAIRATPHGQRIVENGAGIDVRGKQTGNAVVVANAAVSSALTSPGLWRVAATSECIVRFGDSSLTNAANGEYWPAGHVEIVSLSDGAKIAVDAP